MDMDMMPHRSKNQSSRIKHMHRGGRGGSAAHDTQLIIKLPEWRVWRVIARSVFLMTAILAFPWAGSMVRSSEPHYHAVQSETLDDAVYLQMLFRDLSEAGLLRSGHRVLFIGEACQHCEQILKEKIDLVSLLDVELRQSVLNETYDFAFADGFSAAEFMGRALKIGGIMAVRMSGDPLATFSVPLNFKIVYIRQFDVTMIAMEKTGPAVDPTLRSPINRRLCAVASDAKKASLMSGLEEVPLEPLQVNSAESSLYLEQTKYLPDLTGDPLDLYPRRVFIDAGPTGGVGSGSWFKHHYPTRDQEFEIYEVEPAEEGGPLAAPIGVSNWLIMNVREEEYVVMKAEADVVEEMAKSKAICLVDELFLECNHQGQNGKGGKRSRRAYWECLALLGKLRDEGIAVHQWWA
ncbi:uncharacterized protein LOC131242023 [Magnolia sinica]|uniref:uncharacterized protein LOC131242023 n=1 Tax=Magnolia sinica TaxID=86752 RepID=UPI002658339E|nr:uncharacterized protein LOC131242023 [Magnolia sinica]